MNRSTDAHVAVLEKTEGPKGGDKVLSERIYGGYANARGEISLFGESAGYRVNFKNRTLQERPPLNYGAQMRYDAAQPGDQFQFGRVIFRRLDHGKIQEICSSGAFRVRPKPI